MADENKIRAALKTIYGAIADIEDELRGAVEPPVMPPPPPVEEPDPVTLPPRLPIGTAPQGKLIAHLTVESTATVDQVNVPITAGQVFAPGDLPAGVTLTSTVPLQMDVKATHADGSVRHAVLSAIVPKLAAGEELKLLMYAGGVDTRPENIPSAQFVQSRAIVVINGVSYTADNRTTPYKFWLSGIIVNEVQSSSPLIDIDGKPHPHLAARFDTRCYEGGRARVDVKIENNWAYEPEPQNFTYDAVIEVGGKVVYEQKNLTHLHHARWRNLFWHGEEPQVHVKHDTAYLIASRALPNYDQSVTIAESELGAISKKFSGKVTEPMNVGLSVKAMATTGGRDDIGLLPSWAVSALLSMDKRALDATHGTADLAGSWSMHYRDKDTGQPISLMDYPYMTILGNPGDTKNPNRIDPATNKKGVREAFPEVLKGHKSPYSHDSSHQPNFCYLSYLLTGDHYYLEEVQFWAMWNVFSYNPGYRKNIQGLIYSTQVRGQAWNLRSIAEAAYITPDGDRLKEHFTRILNNNLDWYITNYSPGGAYANPMNVIINGGAVVYRSKKGVAPWQNDFFIQAVGHAAELHPTSRAKELLAIVVQFVEQRLLRVNPRAAANYSYPVRAVADGPILTIEEAYKILYDEADDQKEIARLDAGALDMGGYPKSTEGFPANMQPAVSFASKEAWDKFEKRDPKPDYSKGAQFAIVPR